MFSMVGCESGEAYDVCNDLEACPLLPCQSFLSYLHGDELFFNGSFIICQQLVQDLEVSMMFVKTPVWHQTVHGT